ncbi:hypothetical protein HMPREF9225_0116 [Peptoniphilus duerdenii ATCC BAA-1640]|uniref:Uncharacterized protein n=1 Tax=Peptoniphilus duerdenii ATCC BAA-1640 TaxID=862517 RepID=E0NIX7_9FIRM|nr:hypothetical protein HMPREF9225_0116 [Peptoniphilus duerdenii ATCC BAA-1640]
MTVVGKRIFIFFGIDGLNIGQILRLTSFAQDDQVGGISLQEIYKCMPHHGYTRSTPEPSALSLRVTVIGKIL